jgi:histone demethylase JARID1
MFDTFSKDIIYLHLPAPYRQTLFVELVQFQPGSDGGATSGSVSAPMPRPQIVHHQPMQHNPNSHSFSHHNPQPSTSTTVPHTSSNMRNFSASPTTHPSAPPPPPWSRWGTMSTPAMPPSTQRRNNGEGSRSNGSGTPQPSAASTSKKRKHVEEILIHHQQQHFTAEDEPRSSFPLKRHAGPTLTPTPMSPPRPVQTLSPSLAMIVSPTNQAVQTSSPRGNQLPPMRNGSSGSPLLPPVKSLIGGGESRSS